MPPKKTTATDGDAPALPYTEGEIQLAFALLKRLPRPTYDADVIAAEIGSASGSSVRKRVSLATAKYGWFSAASAEGTAVGGDNGDGSTAGTPKTPRAKKTPNTSGRKKKLQETEDGADEDEAGTPSKKKARTIRKPKAKAEETVKEEEEEEGEEVLKVEEDSEVKKQEDTAGDDGQI